MIGKDEELAALLRRWQAPSPGPALDPRVWAHYRRHKRNQMIRRLLPVAAALVLAASLAFHLMPGAKQPQLSTTMDATGFRPVPNGSITVVNVRTKP